jgi:hypothetical protein
MCRRILLQLVFELAPKRALSYRTDAMYSATRYRFQCSGRGYGCPAPPFSGLASKPAPQDARRAGPHAATANHRQ